MHLLCLNAISLPGEANMAEPGCSMHSAISGSSKITQAQGLQDLTRNAQVLSASHLRPKIRGVPHKYRMNNKCCLACQQVDNRLSNKTHLLTP